MSDLAMAAAVSFLAMAGMIVKMIDIRLLVEITGFDTTSRKTRRGEKSSSRKRPVCTKFIIVSRLFCST